ncbi:hypothetical protein MGWOODY_Clf904 [hydrothermal vent metagenome]|uniref:Uncharacterized protein n=1 Tax=hydrothermal vent metagenome TaxID=652676 RepID=A0A160VCU4_9ZZZZ
MDVVVDLYAVDILFDDDVGRVETGVAVNPEYSSVIKKEFTDLVFVEGILRWPYLYLPTGDDDDLAGEVFLHQVLELHRPLFVVVIGDGYSVDALRLYLGHYFLGDGQRRRLKVECFPDMGVQVHFDFHSVGLLSGGYPGLSLKAVSR